MNALDLVEAVRAEAGRRASRADRAAAIAELVRRSTGRRWVGVYAVESPEVANLAWSGPSAPVHPTFPTTQGLTGAAIASRATVVSNDVARDPRYLTALESTGSELIAPVLVGGRVVGTLDVEDERVGAFDDGDREVLERVAAAMTGLYAD